MAHKKALPPKPSKTEAIESNPVFQVGRVTYTGEEARRAKSEAEKRRDLLGRLDARKVQGWRDQLDLTLGVCRLYRMGILEGSPLDLSDLKAEGDTGAYIIETFRAWYTLSPEEAAGLWLMLGRLMGSHNADAYAGALAGTGPKRRKGTPGPFRKAIMEVAGAAGTIDLDEVLDWLEDENAVEDLYHATGQNRIDLHCFEADREGKTISFSDRRGHDDHRSFKTVKNILSAL